MKQLQKHQFQSTTIIEKPKKTLLSTTTTLTPILFSRSRQSLNQHYYSASVTSKTKLQERYRHVETRKKMDQWKFKSKCILQTHCISTSNFYGFGDSTPPKRPKLINTPTNLLANKMKSNSPLPLKNLGNTCYENSIVQCLFNLDLFMNTFDKSMSKVKQLVSSSSENDKQITPLSQDVRYRIAEKFSNLYNTYLTKRSLNNSPITNDKNDETSSSDRKENLTPESSTSEDAKENASENQIPHETTGDRMPQDQETSNQATNQDHQPKENSSPIALGPSNDSNGLSEIETRLEELKSAVGERNVQFNSTHQQDASEFFYHVIDSIQEFYHDLSSRVGSDKFDFEPDPVTKTFELELDYVIACPKCRHKTYTQEKIRTLPLALPNINNESSDSQENNRNELSTALTPPLDFELNPDCLTEYENNIDEKPQMQVDDNQAKESNNDSPNGIKSVYMSKLDLTDKEPQQTKEKEYTLNDALTNYFKVDILDYKCSQENCDSEKRTKKCLIKKLPQVLFITLARYSYEGKKNLDLIEAPFELSVPLKENKSPNHSPSAQREINDHNNMYQLVAVVCHLGSSLNAGHYTSYVYNKNIDTWHSCDDDSITKVSVSDVQSDAARSGYCFFYAHKSSLIPEPDENHEMVTESIPMQDIPIDTSALMTPLSSPNSQLTSSSDDQVKNDHDDCKLSDIVDDWS